MELNQLLKKYFDFEDFRPGQRETIQSILDGSHTIAMLPTGTGKSLCYQMPGYMQEGLVLIVSPLLSLMQDQVEQMMALGEKKVVAMNSFLNPYEKKNALESLHRYKFIFISPEMLGSEIVMSRLLERKISLFVVDEAHCISQWGYDFRPDYLKLGAVREMLGNPLTLALTATAAEEVRRDIAEKLRLGEWKEIVYSVDRPSISLSVESVAHFQEKLQRAIELVSFLEGPGIIYFSSKKMAEQTAASMREIGIKKVMAYHGGLDTESRILIQQQFINGQLDIICATSAFGMGINKENVRFVIHFHMPLQIESYLQEIGRAARDGGNSIAILLYSPGDEQLAYQLAEGEIPNRLQVDRLFHFLANDRLTYRDMQHHEEKITAFCGFTEIQWRIIEDFLSSREAVDYNLDKTELLDYTEGRLHIKTARINQMLEWIHSSDCKRASIVALFNEQLTSSPVNCCSNCGIDLEDYRKNKASDCEPEPVNDWKKDLASMLLIK